MLINKVKDHIAYGVGVDIEDIARFSKVIRNKKFLEKIFTNKEILYCKRFSSPGRHLAVRFAAKEAVIKALGLAGKGVEFNEIEVLNQTNGAPFVNMKRKKLEKKFRYLISLSHSDTKAIAFTIITKREPR